MTNPLNAMIIIALAGSMAAVQASMNAALGKGLGSSTAAATLSFGVGFAGLLVLTVLVGESANLTRVSGINQWLLLGGLLGAFYIWAILFVVPILGIVTAVSAMILGQLIVAILIDAFGPFGLPTHEISLPRVAGVLLVACGLIMSKL